MSDTTIKISNSKDTELEFDVSIQGLTEETAQNADVRFVIANADDRFNMSVKCIKTEGTKWLAKIPAPKLARNDQNFKVEVIVDGYYFEPANGKLVLISEPTVGISESSSKPIAVAASFTQNTVVDASRQVNRKELVESLEFNKDPRFAHQVTTASRVALKSINIIHKGVSSNGEINNKNKMAVAEAIETGKKIFTTLEQLFYKKTK